MTTIFDDRERAFENKWAHDAELHLRIVARRNRKLAEWAVAEKGLDGEVAESRIRELIKQEFQPSGNAAFLLAVTEMMDGDSKRVLEQAGTFEAEAEAEIEAGTD